jgi:hypothetical protein
MSYMIFQLPGLSAGDSTYNCRNYQVLVLPFLFQQQLDKLAYLIYNKGFGPTSQIKM